jgi:putative transposase
LDTGKADTGMVNPHRELVIQALLMAVWNRRPESVVLIHSDQGSQFGSDDWIRFCKEP